MADLQKTYYPEAPNKAIATFSYTDIAEGTGTTLFYLCETLDNSGTYDQILTTQTLRSARIEQTVTTSTQTIAKTLDQDYDLSAFVFPKDIKGTAYFLGCMNVDSNSNPDTTTAYMIIKLRKWNPTTSTETEIASAQSPSLVGTNQGEQTSNFTVPIEISTLAHFASGEVLRVTVEVWQSVTGASGKFTIANEPTNRDGTKFLATDGNFTNTRIYIPFRLDNI